jgi:hypothetical protein
MRRLQADEKQQFFCAEIVFRFRVTFPTVCEATDPE